MTLDWKPLKGGRRRLSMPSPGLETVEVPEPCDCGCSSVRGANMVTGRSTYKSQALCAECAAARGELVVTVSTIFGIEEDERVLYGRARVY